MVMPSVISSNREISAQRDGVGVAAVCSPSSRGSGSQATVSNDSAIRLVTDS